MSDAKLDQHCIDTLRFLSVDMVQKANSGHPGLPLGAAPMAYVLWTRFLKHNPAQSALARPRPLRALGRARLGAALQPAAPDRLRRSRSTTSSSSANGAARRRAIRSAATRRASRSRPGRSARASPTPSAWRSPRRTWRRATTAPGHDVVDHHTYALVSDGDLMEGVASEAASLAGHLQLGKLICLYDDNSVTLSAGTDIDLHRGSRAGASRPTAGRRSAVDDGNDLAAIDAALAAARAETARARR